MVDSWGKADDGMLGTPLKALFPGVMQECVGVYQEGGLLSPAIQGQYCSINTNQAFLPQKYGTCMPTSCTERDLEESVRQSYQEQGWSGEQDPWPAVAFCRSEEVELHWGPWELGGSALLQALAVIVVVATAADLLSPDTTSPFFKSFSASENCAKIFAVSRGRPGEITCFHAIRVLSILWVILGHQYAILMQAASNTTHLIQLTADWAMQIVFSGIRAVDTFFFLGGVLLTRGLLRTSFCARKPVETRRDDGTSDELEEIEPVEVSEERKLKGALQKQSVAETICIFLSRYAYFMFHRIVRLWPGMVVTIAFFAGPAIFLMNGPFKENWDLYLSSCRRYWWWDLTFLTNILTKVSHYNGVNGASCLGVTWYLSVDMQIYLAMPFLILPMKLFKYKQLYLWALILISCAIPTSIIMAGNMPPTQLFNYGAPSTQDIEAYNYKIYLMPWTRSTPYFVGALCAYWLHAFEKCGKTGQELMENFYKKHPLLAALYPRVLGWAAATATALAVVFGLVNSNYSSLFSGGEVPEPHLLTPVETFFYAAFAILAWSLVVAWVVMMCALGLAEPLNWFLSHPMWQPFSRLTFGAFLVSAPFQYMVFASFQEYVYFTHNFTLITWCGVVVLSYLAALPLSLLAEAPVINLLKLARPS